MDFEWKDQQAKVKTRYDFSNAKRGSVVRTPSSKKRITIRIDDDILDWFRGQVHAAGGGNYQTLINAALRAHIDLQAPNDQEGLEETLRRVIREEFPPYTTDDRETR